MGHWTDGDAELAIAGQLRGAAEKYAATVGGCRRRRIDKACLRCGGSGVINPFGKCFRCGGSGNEYKSEFYGDPLEALRCEYRGVRLALQFAKEAARKAARHASAVRSFEAVLARIEEDAKTYKARQNGSSKGV